MHTVVYVPDWSISLPLVYFDGVQKLTGAKLFRRKCVSTGAASPAFVWSRLSLRSRTAPGLLAGLKCQHKLTTALKAVPASHTPSYHKDVLVRWSQLNTSVGPRELSDVGHVKLEGLTFLQAAESARLNG